MDNLASKEDGNTSSNANESTATDLHSESIISGRETLGINPSGTSCTETRRSTVKELIERYFYQLQQGCGNTDCTNTNCASSGEVASMSPNEAAAKALQLFSEDAPLCDSKGTRTQSTAVTSIDSGVSASMSNSSNSEILETAPIPSGACSSNSAFTNTTSASSSRRALGITSLTSLEHIPSSLPNEDRSNDGDADGVSLRYTKIYSKNSNPDVIAQQSGGDTAGSYIRYPLVLYLNEQIIDELIEKGKKNKDNYEELISAIAEVYSSVDKLSQSFRRTSNSVLNQLTLTTAATKLQEILGKSPCDLKKEDLRSLEGENEKDEDSTCLGGGQTTLMDVDELTVTAPEQNENDSLTNVSMLTEMREVSNTLSDDSENDIASLVASSSSKKNKDSKNVKGTCDMTVDLEVLRRVKKKLFALNQPIIAETLNSNIVVLSEAIKYQHNWSSEQLLHCIVICFDMITNISNSLMDLDFLERSLPKLCQAVSVLPIQLQAQLTRVWSFHCKDQLHSLVQCCQQLISLNVIMNEVDVEENSDIIAGTKVLKIAYYASILAGELDPPKNPILNDVKKNTISNSLVMQHDDENELFVFNTEIFKSQYPRYADDDLAKELKLRAMYCRKPVVPFDEFYNEPLSDSIQMDRDYLYYKKLSLDPSGEESHFSFMLYSFILTPATKVVGLYYDSRIRMYSERHTSIYSVLSRYNGESSDLNTMPDLKIKVRRDNIVNDALVGLEFVAMSNPKDLKKQLVIEFVGEQGIDEGGVSKEFFQLIVDEIFNVDFGMFLELDESDSFWFNSMSFENDAQFTLIGIIIGLAIYNNIILAVRFPMVVYRKLMGTYGAFADLKDFSPTLYRSLKSMLEYVDDDMEDVFMQTFKINYQNVFGELVEHELKPGGADIPVGQSNKQDFVDLYADFLLNQSIERQFEAFKKGFEMVTDESPLRLLFRPEEIELLVCGSKKFDFVELEKSTEYEGGYTKDTQIIKDFWEIVHSMPEESKRKLLEFTTGSDRVPVGGLSRLKLLITRHGPDCDRLPTSHTCFNILLLPEYSSKAKLEERLLKAITYSKGFGML